MTPSDDIDHSSLRLVWTDLHGTARGTLLPATQVETAIDEGVGFASGVSELTLESSFVANARYGPEHGNMVAVADLDSVAPLSWREDEAIVFSNLKTPTGDRFNLCSRSVLQEVVSTFKTAGYTPRIGIELEFSLLCSEGESLVPYNNRSSYDLEALDQAAELIDEWDAALTTAGYEPLGIHAESHPGQFELNIRYDDPVTIADSVVFCRHMLKSLARRHEFKATMMPRPYTDEDANGLHFHLSLWNKDSSENQFASDDRTLEFPEGRRDSGLTDEARHFLGGILDHSMALTAVCAPTVNSYKRLVPGRWAPINIAWGPDNRSTAIRIPPELGAGTRIEYRIPDSAVNPYLAFAATFAAGFDGLCNKTEPGQPTLANAYEEEDHNHLPRTLWTAIDNLESNTVLRDALGATLVDEFVKLKRDEFNRSQESVSAWEQTEYLDSF
ncbi:glutamine synthetase [Natrialba taiwanensis DSM 12281]|uniref:Glutamine synthetase n=2 Tax=Natrialba taiwanensis TaxID=160846 RepID=L9ZKX3_9EURY|nr:glutamine synthetase [Natrialba taiwanensis DSM 12281]